MSEEIIRQKLRELGATNPEGTSGIIPVSPPKILEPQILEYKVRDTTPIGIKVRRTVVDPRMRKMAIMLETKFYRTQGLLRKLCTMYKDPTIDFELVPVKVRNITFHAFSLKLTGDVVLRFTNKSKEGEEGTLYTWRWRSCPTDPDAYNWKVVEGSADLTPSWNHDFVEDSTGALLSRLNMKLSKVSKGHYVEPTGYWETKGLGDLVWSILSILITGKVATRNGFDVTINYYWLGKTQTINRHIDAKVVLPVEGNIGWSWD